jgi:hypothetical protein
MKMNSENEIKFKHQELKTFILFFIIKRILIFAIVLLKIDDEIMFMMTFNFQCIIMIFLNNSKIAQKKKIIDFYHD